MPDEEKPFDLNEFFEDLLSRPHTPAHERPELLDSFASACIEIAKRIISYKPDTVIVPLKGAYPIYRGVRTALRELGHDPASFPLFFQISTTISPTRDYNKERAKIILDSILHQRLKRESPEDIASHLREMQKSIEAEYASLRKKTRGMVRSHPDHITMRDYKGILEHLNERIFPYLESIKGETAEHLRRLQKGIASVQSIRIPKFRKVLVFDELATGLGMINMRNALRVILPKSSEYRLLGVEEKGRTFLPEKVRKELGIERIPVRKIISYDRPIFVPTKTFSSKATPEVIAMMKELYPEKNKRSIEKILRETDKKRFNRDIVPNIEKRKDGSFGYPEGFHKFYRNLDKHIKKLARSRK